MLIHPMADSTPTGNRSILVFKQLFDVPLLLGGVEASLRRVSHYDYWNDSLHKTILADTGADLLIYGMGELPLKELIKRLRNGEQFNSIRDIPQTAFLCSKGEVPENAFGEEVLFSSRSF